MRQAAVLVAIAIAAVITSCHSTPEHEPSAQAGAVPEDPLIAGERQADIAANEAGSEPAPAPPDEQPPVELKRADRLAERPRPPPPKIEGPRRVDADDIVVPAGYEISVVAKDLTFPTGIAFDELGRPNVVEAGFAPNDIWTEPQLIRIEPNAKTIVAKGPRNGPWNGVAFGPDNKFYVAEGGQVKGGRLVQISREGKVKLLANTLPTRGDHQTTGPAIGPDGAIYFGVGTATNAGIVGPDNDAIGWLQRAPTFHDVPCRDVTLTGRNFASKDVLGDKGEVETGAYKAFGEASQPGEVIAGRVPCNGSIMRYTPEGGAELVAWGLRNPFGLAFSPDGKLFVTDQRYDDRGSRKVRGGGDKLWRIEGNAWYGWPDLGAEGPVSEPLLARAPGPIPAPAAELGMQASPGGMDFSTSQNFGHVGEAFIALAGERVPQGRGRRGAPAGYKIVTVDVATGRVEDFAVNRRAGPASKSNSGGLERPIALRFSPHGQALYVVDYGVVLLTDDGPAPQRGTGVVWRITRKGSAADREKD